MTELLFLDVDDVIEIQKEILSSAPVTDIGKLESGLRRAEQYYYYEAVTDIVVLASYIILGIAKAHAFPDGNKRTSFLSGAYFLEINGYEIEENPEELSTLVEQLASDAISVLEFSLALKKYLTKI